MSFRNGGSRRFEAGIVPLPKQGIASIVQVPARRSPKRSGTAVSRVGNRPRRSAAKCTQLAASAAGLRAFSRSHAERRHKHHCLSVVQAQMVSSQVAHMLLANPKNMVILHLWPILERAISLLSHCDRRCVSRTPTLKHGSCGDSRRRRL